MRRRDFLKNGIMIVGAAATGTVVGVAAASDNNSQPETSGDGGEKIPAMTADGRVVHLPVTAPSHPKAAEPTGRQGVANRKWIMVIDLAKCDGCAHCTVGCAKMHYIPPDRQYIPVLVMKNSPLETPYFFPRPCYHCDNPPCTKVCPVNATYKTQDGTVLVDNERCIGCRFCMAGCPYGVRVFNWGRPVAAADQPQDYSPEWGYPRRVGTVEKCDFCPEHAAMGMLPACSQSCPMGAIYFGDELEDAVTNSVDETLRLSTTIRDRAAYRHLENLGTQPRVYYLPPVHRQYPAPGESKEKAK